LKLSGRIIESDTSYGSRTIHMRSLKDAICWGLPTSQRTRRAAQK
jgi:hypothetical protein